ncbi:hypothetical protein C6503_04820 [Candidatus Poribacteria bacterium]|nr:MAG: hypothetical protein C6503_04820 [Candidatus Poribacteria bacterium]
MGNCIGLIEKTIRHWANEFIESATIEKDSKKFTIIFFESRILADFTDFADFIVKPKNIGAFLGRAMNCPTTNGTTGNELPYYKPISIYVKG